MAEVNFYLRETTPNKVTAVMMFFSFRNNRFKVGTVDKINTKFWDSENQRAKQTKAFPTHPEFNTGLQNKTTIALDVYRSYLNDNEQQQPTPDHLKELIKAKLLADKNKGQEQPETITYNLLSFVELFIKECVTGKRLSDKGTPIQPNTIKIYNTLKNNLEAFKKEKRYNLSFENIDLAFFEDYKDYMTFEKKYATNTLSKHIRVLKSIMNDAVERELTKTAFIGKRYKAKTEQTETVYLDKAELKRLYELDLSKETRLERVRDLFIVGCWTGLRFSDFNDISPKNIKGDFIEIKTQKTKKTVIVPIHSYVREIMKKYVGKTENSLPPTISNQKMNEYLKDIAKEAKFNELISLQFTKAGKEVITNVPKYSLISSHTARRSFATNMYLDNFPTISIMAITGHTTESSFMKYIRVTPKEHAEKLKLHWNEPLLKVV
jgi:integrase